MTQFSIASYAFHRALAAGEQDMFRYITDSQQMGMSQLDPWNAHLAAIKSEDEVIKGGTDPENAAFSAQSMDYIDRVKAAAAEVGLPFGCVAVDGAHIYEDDPARRRANRAQAYRWLDVAERLGASQIRIDCGGPADLTDEIFEIIVDGYNDIIPRARDKGLEVLIENHWGPSPNPDNVLRMLDNIDGLGLLFDSNNFIKERQEEGWRRCAPYARSVHIKTFSFDANGDDPSVDLRLCLTLLRDAGYDGCYGIESVPEDGDEYGAIEKTKALIGRVLAE